MEEQIITTISKPSMSFKRGKNGLAWELKMSGDTFEEIMEEIEKADEKLKEKYGDEIQKAKEGREKK